MAGKESTRWNENVKQVQSGLNICVNKSTGKIPLNAFVRCETKPANEGWILNEIRYQTKQQIATFQKQ